MAEKPKIKLTINSKALKKIYGDSVLINVDENGTPLDRYWRNRVRDAKKDDCVTLKKTATVAKKSTAVKSKTSEGEK